DSSGVTAAGGLLIQVMPKASEDEALVELLESRVSHLTGFTPLLQAGKSLPQIFEELLGDMGLVIFPETQMLQFQCKCSNNRMLGALKLLGVDELQDMIQTDNGAEVTCDLCGEKYQATRQELHKLVQELQKEA
ncbi:MAG: redox-regulated molecular chaperone Hsp33, partial [Merismopedia sp. SIO2A8]|nr:redox-regulated molecular chaperone Hsp33 [Merismopedia sp. SIO2A8]